MGDGQTPLQSPLGKGGRKRCKFGVGDGSGTKTTPPQFAIGWAADGAVVSKSGDLGYTYGFGERTIRGKDGKAKAIAAYYVSIWRRESDGE